MPRVASPVEYVLAGDEPGMVWTQNRVTATVHQIHWPSPTCRAAAIEGSLWCGG